ncbi:MAG: hypothetical protein ACPGEF_03230 [Endozoicomonas sp.]
MQTDLSSLIIDTAPPSLSTEEKSNKQLACRKRHMAVGYLVGQTAVGTGVLSGHKQPFGTRDDSTTDLKRRRINTNSDTIPCLPSTSVQSGREPMEIVPITRTTIYDGVLSEFTVLQRSILRENPKSQKINSVLHNAKVLLQTLNKRDIELSKDRGNSTGKTLFTLLKNFKIFRDANVLSEYFAKANVFFLAVDTELIIDTTCFTTMFKTRKNSSLIKNFLALSDDHIKEVASRKDLKSITRMMKQKGFPCKERMKELNQGGFQLINSKPYRASVSSMITKDVSKGERMEKLINLDCLKVDDELNPVLLKHITSINYRKGVPEADQVKKFMAWDCLKENGKLCMGRLKIIARMFHRKGFPEEDQVEKFMRWDCWKVNGKFSMKWLEPLTIMMNGKGLLDEDAVKKLMLWDCWKLNGKLCWELLQAIAILHTRRGLPQEKEVADYMLWDCWKVNGKFSPELLRAISLLYYQKGIPTNKLQVTDFINEDRWQENGKISIKQLKHFAREWNGKGVPIKEPMKKAVPARLEQAKDTKVTVITAAPEQQPSTSMPMPMGEVFTNNSQEPQATFEMTMDMLDPLPILKNVELDLLELDRERVETVQLRSVSDIDDKKVDTQTYEVSQTSFESSTPNFLGLDDMRYLNMCSNISGNEQESGDEQNLFAQLLNYEGFY